MSESMRPSEFFEYEVLPILFDRLNEVFPEFGFKRTGKGWEATIDPGQFGVRADRIAVLARSPHCLTIAGGESITLLGYTNGGEHPSGKRYVDLVRELAELVGVDSSVLDGKKLTPTQKREIKQRHEEMRNQARMRHQEQQKREAQESVKKIAEARELIERAVEHGDRSVAERYFIGRGRVIENLPGGKLPYSIQYVPDCGFRTMTRAVLGIVIDEDYLITQKPCAAQRMFVDNQGKAIEVNVGGKPVRKAAVGRPFGGMCLIGELLDGEPIVLCEGIETGLAIHECTGWPVGACISAGGLEKVSLKLLAAQLERTESIVIIAGDLDSSKINERGKEVGLAGQRSCVYAADRIRHELKVPVAELLPSHQNSPGLVSSQEQPLEGKSVDWEDPINLDIDRIRTVFEVARNAATNQLTQPEQFEPMTDPEPTPEEKAADDAAEDQQKPRDNRIWEPYAPVFPSNILDAAHEVLLAHHGPSRMERYGGGLHAICISGELYLWKDNCWTRLGGKPNEVLRRVVRRHFKDHCKPKPTKEVPPDFYYVDANLSESVINSVTSAAVDEISIVHPADDFTARFWHRPNVAEDERGDLEVVQDDVAWGRVVHDPSEFDWPDATEVIPTRTGNINVAKWRENTELELIPSTPLLFNLGRIEATLPIEGAIEAYRQDQMTGLDEYARELCPEMIAFLERSFAHNDDECAPAVIREVFKYFGNLLAGDMGHHEANIGWFVGPSGSGKSVLLRVLEAVLGIQNMVSSTMSKLTDQFHLSSWIGKMYAAFPDMDIGGRSDKKVLVELLKMISTDDPMSVDRKYIPEVPNIRLGVRIGIFTNNMPTIPDPTRALIRRSIVFEMRNAVKRSEQDPDLHKKLTTPRSLQGILLLSLIGIKHLDEDGGFIQPKWYQGLLDDLARQSSEYAEMVDAYVEVTNDHEHHALERDLYELYRKFGELNGQSFNPKQASMLSQLKTVLTGGGFNWARCEEERDGRRALIGIRINDEGMRLINATSGSDSGGHTADSFLETA